MMSSCGNRSSLETATLELPYLLVGQISELLDVPSPIFDAHPVMMIENAAHSLQICHFRPRVKLS
jgi:hypothetical protein